MRGEEGAGKRFLEIPNLGHDERRPSLWTPSSTCYKASKEYVLYGLQATRYEYTRK